MIVPDSSVLVDALLGRGGETLAAAVFDGPQVLHVPHLLDLEVTQTLRKLVSVRRLDAARADEAMQDHSCLPLVRHPHQPYLERIWQLRHYLTAYDAAYVALAEALGCVLLTRDRGLAAAGCTRIKIRLF